MIRLLVFFMFAISLVGFPARADDFDDIMARGVIRHLGVPYANFVTGSGDGLDADLVRLFAASLGLAYEYVPTTWEKAIGDLTGYDMVSGARVKVWGDILANGVTILDWRKKRLIFSYPTFPSQVWLIARADSPVKPIVPGKTTAEDIRRVMALVKGRQVMGMAMTCLEPKLYGLERSGAQLRYFKGSLNELAPAVINNEVGLSLLDVPDALVALEKWSGLIKIIGPVSQNQNMAVAARKTAPKLIEAFNRFFMDLWHQGKYRSMVETYYPVFPAYYPRFFAGLPGSDPGPLK
ncbi:MAG: transporter substrate-binding domain-containing protein [Desulfobacter sp.]|nr:transporter substrate-binding domain-containing protein [Desulfobacter sp.]